MARPAWISADGGAPAEAVIAAACDAPGGRLAGVPGVDRPATGTRK
jgi:hypothetical protein